MNLQETWAAVNAAAHIEDIAEIKRLMVAAGIPSEPMHTGEPKEFFEGNPCRVAEWALSNFHNMIVLDSPWLNTARNISFSQYEKTYGSACI